MRISTSYRYEYFSSVVSQTASTMFDAQQRVSTGKRLNSPSDDPSGATFSVKARDLRASLAQYDSNIFAAKQVLGTSDNALASIGNLLNAAKTTALKGANGTNSAQAMSALAVSVREMATNLVTYANAQAPDGRYVFSGQSTDKKPFSELNGSVSYAGDTADIKSEVSPGNAIVTNTQGSPLLSDIYNALETLQNKLASNDSAAVASLSLQAIDDLTLRVTLARGQIGSKSQTVTELSAQNRRRSDELSTAISNVEDVDMTQAISDYQQANTAYQAALTVSSQSSKLSLMDFLK